MLSKLCAQILLNKIRPMREIRWRNRVALAACFPQHGVVSYHVQPEDRARE